MLEGAIPSITAGSLPPALPPFFASGMIYIPVIARARSVDDVLNELALIFVALDTDRLRPLLDWSLPAGMPDGFRRAGATGADDVQGAVGHSGAVPIRRPRSIARRRRSDAGRSTRSVIADYDRIGQDALSQGIQGIDKFYGIFLARAAGQTLKPAARNGRGLVDGLRAAPAEDAERSRLATPEGASRQQRKMAAARRKAVRAYRRRPGLRLNAVRGGFPAPTPLSAAVRRNTVTGIRDTVTVHLTAKLPGALRFAVLSSRSPARRGREIRLRRSPRNWGLSKASPLIPGPLPGAKAGQEAAVLLFRVSGEQCCCPPKNFSLPLYQNQNLCYESFRWRNRTGVAVETASHAFSAFIRKELVSLDFFIFSTRNALKSPDSEKLMKGNES